MCRSKGTLVHMLEAQDYNQPQESMQDYNYSPETTHHYNLHNIPPYTSFPEKSYTDWVPMNKMSISDQHGLHILRTLESTRWMWKLTQGQDAM